MSFSSICVIFAIIATVLNVAGAEMYTTQIALGECSAFTVHGGSKVAFEGGVTNVRTGNVGMSPGTAVTGTFTLKGEIDINGTGANACAADRRTAYDAAKAAVCSPANIRNELGVQEADALPPGVYCDAGAEMSINTNLYLDGQNPNGPSDGVWIFQASSSLLTALNTQIILLNGAKAENVFWAVSSSATLGTSSKFVGTLMTYASITLQTKGEITGQALAGAAVNFETTNSITNPRVAAV